MNHKETGEDGELEVIKLVPCPNCKKKLMKLPKNTPYMMCSVLAVHLELKSKRLILNLNL